MGARGEHPLEAIRGKALPKHTQSSGRGGHFDCCLLHPKQWESQGERSWWRSSRSWCRQTCWGSA